VGGRTGVDLEEIRGEQEHDIGIKNGEVGFEIEEISPGDELVEGRGGAKLSENRRQGEGELEGVESGVESSENDDLDPLRL
jgi:hypothetical protein